MGNTPKPCDSCKHLYYDCMQKDNPAYDAECKYNCEMGNKDCESYTKWIDKDDVLMRTFKRKICDRADEIDPTSELDWYSLSIGFFMALGLDSARAGDYANEARYTYGYWQ